MNINRWHKTTLDKLLSSVKELVLKNAFLKTKYSQIEFEKYDNIFEQFPFGVPWLPIIYTSI